MNSKTVRRSILSLALAGALAGPGFTAFGKDTAALDVARQLNKAFIELAETVSPSVVVISVVQKSSAQFGLLGEDGGGSGGLEGLPEELRKQFERWFDGRHGRPREKDGREKEDSGDGDEPFWNGQGSGLIVRADGYIVTNFHVVNGAEKLRVRLKDGREFEAEVRGSDEKSDLAVIQLKGEVKNLVPAKLADSSKVRVGEFAVAIGAPFELDYSVTFGHVSAKGRSKIIPNRTADQDFIQTDANINPGNSGGPLVNIDGEVIGINAMIRGLHTGIGFAIPADLVKQVSDAIIENGRFARPWLGIEMSGVKENPEYRAMAKRGLDGVVVGSIVPDGPASKSELRIGDIITHIDGRPVTTSRELKNEIRGKKVGVAINLDVIRQKKNLTLKVKTEEWPEQGMPVANKKSPAASSSQSELGITVKSLTKEVAKEFDVDPRDGVIVTEVEAGSIAARRDAISRGDIITEVNQEKVTNAEEFKKAMAGASVKEGVMLTVISKDEVARLKILKDRSE